MKHKIFRFAFALLSLSLLLTAPRAQQQTAVRQSDDQIALYQALLDLSNPWTVMCIAAHPDDEDGTSLIVMRRKYGAHTVSLFSTFGEGGQNAIGPELYEELGAIRARETMAAAVIQGSEPHFLGLRDFGYSKSADEAFRFWGHEEALRRMVLEIRKLRPDVIITNHSVTNNDHGHHQATARLELEAFDAAADPKRFPEQLSGSVTTWQVQRLFVRARGNQNQIDNSPVVTIDPNEQDKIRGTTFAAEALSALQKHATQGPWPKTVAQMAARFSNSSDARLPLTRYRLVREARGAQPLTRDADSFLAGLVIPVEMQPRLVMPEGDDAFIPMTDRERLLSSLLALAKRFHQRNSSHDIVTMPEVAALEKRINAALGAAAGISVEVAPETTALVPGVPTNFTITVTNHGNAEARLSAVDFGGMAIGSGRPANTPVVAPGQSVTIVREFQTPRNAAVTVPHQEHLYDGREFGEQFTVRVQVSTIGGSFLAPATASVDVVPAIELAEIGPASLVITPQTESISRTLTLQVTNHDKDVRKISIETIGAGDNPESTRRKIAEQPLTIGPAEKRDVSISLPIKTKTEMIKVYGRVVSTLGQPSATAQEPTPVAPSPRLLVRATNGTSNEIAIPMVYAAARVAPHLRVGYVRGFDYSLPNALTALGVESRELSVDEVKTADLQKYTSIIVDNRVYESTPGLIAANQKLLDYANAGGTLIVFYHKSFEWNPDERRQRPQLAPYKLILGDERIVDENAPITFLEPQHPLLNFPNKIGPEDFANWIQERGLYYPKEWDPQFHALLQSNDPGEPPLKGGLLVADYGRGRYIYTSMVWYRELRAGVPGAYRMLANMISYGGAK
jgi:LmbE family N-acetylglucosaminyl deacetylase